jgi:hypothetical protein
LALSLLAEGSDTPTELRVYLENVLKQASALLHDPHKNIDQLPESIELAYEMQRLLEVRKIVETILANSDLEPAGAKNLLRQLEQNNAGQERSSADRILP